MRPQIIATPARPRQSVGRLVVTLLPVVLLAAFALSPRVAAAQALRPTSPDTATFTTFVQTATAANTSGDSTVINNAATNGTPNAILFVTANWNPSGTCGCVYNDHPVGVWYVSNPLALGAEEWAIFNEDRAPMPIGASFNVLVNGMAACGEWGDVGAIPPIYNYFLPGMWFNPNTLLFVTPNWSVQGVYDADATGVWWDAGAGQWGIFNENPQDNMPQNADFNVYAC